MMFSAVLSDTSESLAASVSSNENIWIAEDADESDLENRQSTDKSVSQVSSEVIDKTETDVSGSDESDLDVSGSDVGGSDANVSDVSGGDIGSDSGDVSGSDMAGSDEELSETSVLPEPFFYVETQGGDTIRGYADWTELLAAFDDWGSLSGEYTITVAKGGVIGTTMPSKAGKVTLLSEENGELLFSGDTVNMSTALGIGKAFLCVKGSDTPVNFNTKGKTLTLNGTKNLGMVKGTSAGSLVMNGDVEIQGNLQTFKSVTIAGSLELGGNLSAVANLDVQSGVVYLAAGKSMTVTNVAAGESGVLSYPQEGTFPTVKITGTVQGVLGLKQYADEDGQRIEKTFTAGSKLLTASKSAAAQFALFGERQVCYKKGSVVYAGAEVLQLYAGEKLLGTYAQWSDLAAKINSLNQKNTSYTVELLDDFVINGAMTMPGKGKYGGLTIACTGKDNGVSLQTTGNLSLTANLVLGEKVHLEVSGAVSGAAWRLEMNNHSSLTVKGAVTLSELAMDEATSLRLGGKFTVKKSLSGEDGAELILTQKKGAAIKDTVTEGDAAFIVRVLDSAGKQVTLAQGTTLFTATGNSYAAQYRLMDADNQELALYKKGNAIKVQGTVTTPITLYYSTAEGEQSLGEYAALADVKTEIARRKESKASYRVDIREPIFVKGSIPLPAAGTYQEIKFTGAMISTTGNLTLTGNVVLTNAIRKVKSEQSTASLPWAVNVSKYKLTISDDRVMENLGSITGAAGSCLQLGSGQTQKINGDVKVQTLVLGREMQVTGNIVVTDISPETGNCLIYDLNKSITIKGAVKGDEIKLVLSPLKNGKQLSVYTEALRVLNSASKVSLERLQMSQDTEYVFYKDGSAVRLGVPAVRVFAGTLDYQSCQSADAQKQPCFVRVNDAIEYINSQTDSEFVVRLDANAAASGALKTVASGKHIVFCGQNGEQRTLQLSGSITLDGSSLEVRNIKLDNKTSAGPGVVLKNGASLTLCDTAVNTLKAPTGTYVTLEGKVSIGGAVSGACSMTVQENSVVRGAGNITVGSLTLQMSGQTKKRAEFRLQTGKKLTVSGIVDTGEDGIFLINQVNKSDAVNSVKAGTVMAVTQYGKASQFKTENLMPGSFSEWALTKSGTSIKTVEGNYDDGEWSGDYY
jgi:hypothetical protein